MSKKQLSNPTTLRLPVDVLAQIENIAEICDRPRSWVIVRALRHYLADEGARIAAIKRGSNPGSGGHPLDPHETDELELVGHDENG